MFPMPRVVYAIASDGLIFKFLSKVLPKVKTPAVATILTGILTGE
jgi:cationic amino acid transporter 3